MYTKPKSLASYGKIANTETDPIKQVVMLYDGAIKFLKQTADDIKINDLAAKAEHSGRALEIILYMQSILDFKRGGEVAQTLDRLYLSVTRMILRASADLDAGLMLRAAEMLVPVRDAWAVNAQKTSENVELMPPPPPVYENSSAATINLSF